MAPQDKRKKQRRASLVTLPAFHSQTGRETRWMLAAAFGLAGGSAIKTGGFNRLAGKNVN
ncbi:MAG: hypothetical protein J7493_13565 [Porphyrobacter sp.]|nr:hypothetical protein [Porphyrobacter sp.]